MDSCVWNYDYVRLAWDSGFCFDNSRVRSALDWSSIGLVDVDKVIADRDIAVIEKHIPDVLQFTLSEELSRILEPNFVKLFRLSQLSVQYLIFCKKYLDNTVNLLKKELAKSREEHNKWASKESNYKEQISGLKRKNKELKNALDSMLPCEENTFQCPECNKVFSTKEFLEGHIKRRHEVNELIQTETDKLQLEIKQLKEQLNSTEKFGKLETVSSNDLKSNDSSIREHSSRIKDLQVNFDRLKSHVENELSHVNDQKFYLEKCEKWMELAFLKLGSQQEFGSQEKLVKIFEPHHTPKSNSSTQTLDVACSSTGKVENFITNNEEQRFKVEQHLSEIFKLQEQIKKDTSNQIGQFEEVVQEKVSSSLQKLENQMELFWEKLGEIKINEKKKEQQISKKEDRNNEYQIIEKDNVDSFRLQVIEQPQPKPRRVKKVVSTAAKKDENILEDIPQNDNIIAMPRQNIKARKPTTSSGDFYSHSNVNVKVIRSTDAVQHKAIENTIQSESMSSEIESIVKVPSKEDISTISSNYSKDSVSNENFVKVLRKDIEQAVYKKLKDVGVSEKWKGLPEKSFEKALKLIRHQASITSKTYPEYANIKGKIVKDVDTQVKSSHRRKHSKSTKPSVVENSIKSPLKTVSMHEPTHKQNIFSKTLSEKQFFAKPQVKNQGVTSMYASSEDISAEAKPKTLPSAINVSTEQKKSFLSELKENITSRKETSDSEEIDVPTAIQTKSLLKNSNGSMNTLAKKKVLFDLESVNASDKEKPLIIPSGYSEPHIVVEKPQEDVVFSPKIVQNQFSNNKIKKLVDSESTSIGSSVLELDMKNTIRNKEEKEKMSPKKFDDEASDWDISDLLMNN